MTKVIYTGFFVNQEEVLKQFPVDTEKYPNVFAHHCTSTFKPTDEEVENFKNNYSNLNEKSDWEVAHQRGYLLAVIKRVQTDKVDVLIIGGGHYSDNKYPHITLATAEGVKPFESNAEILKLEKEKRLFISANDWQDYVRAFPGLYTSNNKVKKLGQAVIVDIDRTLCDIELEPTHEWGSRKPYEWGRVVEDIPIEPICQLVRNIQHNYHIVLLTGRSEEAREGTEEWLRDNFISYDKLLMKDAGSYENTAITKCRTYIKDIKDEYDVAFAIDDDPNIVDMWKKEGILCLKV